MFIKEATSKLICVCLTADYHSKEYRKLNRLIGKKCESVEKFMKDNKAKTLS